MEVQWKIYVVRRSEKIAEVCSADAVVDDLFVIFYFLFSKERKREKLDTKANLKSCFLFVVKR
jgi:hypothetical protein